MSRLTTRSVAGSAAALASMAILTVAMLPLRAHLSIATTALILVVPVVIGVVLGGFRAGAVSVAAGFLVYDFFFIPPYLTLWIGAPQNWAALGVYAAVMLPIAHVVARLDAARSRARRQEREIRELFEVSDLLVEEKPLDELLSVIVSTLADVFSAPQVALLLPRDNRLEVAASAGPSLSEQELRRIVPSAGQITSGGSPARAEDGLLVLALAAVGRPVGLLVISGRAAARHEREPLLIFANQIALAVERAQLREQALRARVTEEMAQLARTLVAAVSHDLRTPLASIKASSSTLADPALDISSAAARRLATLIDTQADRLADLVQNLLDMSRIQAGVLRPRCEPTALPGLISAVSSEVTREPGAHQVRVAATAGLPLADIDPVLITRVITNLLENAIRHGPGSQPVIIDARLTGPGIMTVRVTDRGPGVSPDRRSAIFEMFARRDAGAGLGLAIAKTFVEAHGQQIWVEEAPGGGARFCFTLPAVSAPRDPATRPGKPASAGTGAEQEEPAIAADSRHR